MKGLQVVGGILALCVTMPIWFFLLYRILDAVNASELTWFLYWIYLPTTVFVGTISKLTEGTE